MNNTVQKFDRKVVARAYRFIARQAGFHLKRGDRMGTETNRADRWYLVPLNTSYEQETHIKSQSKGFPSMKKAADNISRERE